MATRPGGVHVEGRTPVLILIYVHAAYMSLRRSDGSTLRPCESSLNEEACNRLRCSLDLLVGAALYNDLLFFKRTSLQTTRFKAV